MRPWLRSYRATRWGQFHILSLTLEFILVGGFHEAEPKFTSPCSCRGKVRSCLTYPASGRTAFQKVGESGSPRCAYHVGTGPKGRTLCAHRRWAEPRRDGRGLLGAAVAQGPHPPVSGPADVLLSAGGLLPFLWGRVSKNQPITPGVRQGHGSWGEAGPEVTLTPERLKC